jgi:predicted metalloprotease with PDZ domain
MKWIYGAIFNILLLAIVLSCSQENTIGPYEETLLSKEEIAMMNFKIDISHGFKNNEPRLIIEESFSIPRKRFGLQLPNNFMRQDRLFDQIEDLEVTNAELFSHEKLPYIKLIKTDGDERVTLRYLVKPLIKENFSSSIIRDNYFQFVGSMLLITPIALDPDSDFNVSFNWNLSDKFKILNSFGCFDKGQYFSSSLNKLWDALFVGGSDIRYKKIIINKNPIHIVFNGYWNKFNDDDLTNMVNKLITLQRNTWNDNNFPYFLVSFLSLDKECSSRVNYAGTAHQNSFRAYFPQDCPLLSEMNELISHELMHMWIGKKIIVGQERGKIDGKWFTEGFSDYYGRLMAYRAGLINENNYFNSLNRELENYSLSSEKHTSLSGLVSRMYKKESSSIELEKLPYQQGELMAINLNKDIKIASNFKYSLDNVIKDMLNEAKNNGQSKNFSIDELDSIFKRYLTTGIKPYLTKIINGEVINPTKLIGCKELTTKKTTSFRQTVQYITNTIFYYKNSMYDDYNCDKWLK